MACRYAQPDGVTDCNPALLLHDRCTLLLTIRVSITTPDYNALAVVSLADAERKHNRG
jgi:hypothetical protein